MTSNTSKLSSKKLGEVISNQAKDKLAIRSRLESINLKKRVEQLHTQVERLHENIIKDKDDLTKYANECSQSPSSLVATKKVFFKETLDDNATIANIISHYNKIVECFKKSGNRINKGMGDILDIIQVLTELENDIYAVIEEPNNRLNEFLQLVDEIHREQVELNSTAEYLFKNSFKRILILRDRIKAINDEISQIKDEVSTTHLDIVKTQETIATLKTEINNETDKKLDQYIKKEVVYTQKEVDDLLCKKCKKIWIVYGMSTIILLAGLIASFLI